MKLRNLSAIVSIMVLLAAPFVQAADLYWSGNGTSLGGTGTWDTATARWGSSSIGPFTTLWNNSNTDVARFGSTVGAVALGATVNVGGLWFDTTAYTLTTTGYTLNFAAANNTITLNTIAAATITGPVGGTGNVTLTAVNPSTAGTLTLNGTSTGGWSGTTTINNGMTLALAGSNQALLNTTGITLNGGGISLANTNNTEGALDRVAAVTITANGGTITYNNTATGTAYAETLGTLALTTGQLNIVSPNAVTTGTETLTLGAGSLTHAAANTSAITFSGTSLGLNAKNSIIISSEGTTAVGAIIGPWATYGTTAAAQTDYATYNRTAGGADNGLGIQNAAIAATTQGSWLTSGNAYTVNTAETLGATRTITALRNTLAAGSVTLATGANLETYGILNGAAALTVAPGTGGVLTTPSGGGNLHLTAGAGTITVSAPINNNGAGVVTVVKNGSSTLTLSSTTSTYSGGTVLNAGTVSISADTNLGAANSTITFNGSATLQHTATVNVGSRPITLNNGAIATIRPDANNKNFTTSGAVTGNGGLTVSSPSGNQASFSLLATGDGITTGNTFTGPITIGDGGAVGVPLTMASLSDSANPIVLNSGSGSSGGGWTYGSGATTSLTLNNRQFRLGSAASTGSDTINNASTKNLTINTDIGFVGMGVRGFSLAGGSATVTNVFAGRITDNAGGALSLAAGGTWYLSGTNTYSGYTTLGTGVLYIQGLQALSPNTTTIEIPHSGSVPLRLLGDGTGTVNYPNTTIYCNGNNAGTTHGIFVGNNTPANGGNNPGSPGTNCTIAFANMTFFQKSDNGNINVDVTGANGFRLQLNNVTLPITGQSTSGNITFSPSTAPITLAGTIIQTNGNPSTVGPKTLVLGGTSASGTNWVTGNIMNAADYPSNVNAKALAVTKSSTSTWTLSGTNTYSGTTTISAGTLVLSGINTGSGATFVTAGKLVGVVGGSCSNSDVYVSAGTTGISVIDTTKSWACKSLSYPAAAALEFAFGANTPSTNVAPLQVGNVAFPVAPTVSCTGSSLTNGTYPLITWTGFISGGAPSSVTVAGTNGTLVLDTANKTLWLVISASSPGSKQPLTWKGGGDGIWVAGEPVYTKWQDATPAYTNYQEYLVGGITVGDNVVFSNAPGGVVTLNTIVSPASVLVTGTSNYTFSGSSIGGGGALTKSGAGTLTLSSANSYSGGTRLSAGTLSLANDNALGTGGITLNGGTIQSSDASARTLANSVVLNGSTTLGGTGNLNFTTGAGLVTAASTLTVTNNLVTFGGPIDGAYGITKLGSGTMTLSGANTYRGGTTVNGGTLVVNGGQNTGGGAVTIGNVTSLNTMIVNGGTLTNVSSIGIGQLPTGAADIRYNSLVLTNGAQVHVNGAVSVANVQYSTSTKYLAFNSMIIADGGKLFSVGGNIGGNTAWSVGVSNLVRVIGGGSVGSSVMWILGGGDFIYSPPDTGRGDIAYNTVMVDGAGVIGGAVMTNVGALTICGTANSMVLTNGARIFSANPSTIGNNGARMNTMTIVGDSAQAIWSAGGASLSVGAGSSSTSNQLVISSGGILANVGIAYIGSNIGGGTSNRVVVQNGGEMYASSAHVGWYGGSGGGIGSRSAMLIEGGGVANFSGAMYVGSYPPVFNYGGTFDNNDLTITSGGQLLTAGDSHIGTGMGNTSYAGTHRNNRATIGGSLGGTNAMWNLNGRNLYVGGASTVSGSVSTGNVLTVNSGGVVTNISALIIKATNSLALGPGGQIYAVAVTNAGTMAVGIDTTVTPACGCLNVTSNLNVNATRLDIITTGKPIGTFVIASYKTLTAPGVFAATNGLPDNCTLYMDYKGLKQVAIVGVRKGTLIYFQ